MGRSFSDRIVKIRARQQAGEFRHGSGFVVAPGTVITAAHALGDATEVFVAHADGRGRSLQIDGLRVRRGDVRGPRAGRAPDLAILEVDGVLDDVDVYPIALLERDEDGIERVLSAEVAGYPGFAEVRGDPGPEESRVRDLFHARGSLSLLSGRSTGRVQVQLEASPPDTEAWDGMSGAPLIVRDRLVGIIVEHPTGAGEGVVTAVPLTALDEDDEHPEWGSGVENASEWWSRLGVARRDLLETIPPRDTRPRWLRRLAGLHRVLGDPKAPVAGHDAVDAFPQILEVLLAQVSSSPLPAAEAMAAVFGDDAFAADVDARPRYAVHLREPATDRSLRPVLDRLATVVAKAGARDLEIEVGAPMLDPETLELAASEWVRSQADPEAASNLVDSIRCAVDDPLGDLVSALCGPDGIAVDCARAIRLVVDRLLLWDGRSETEIRDELAALAVPRSQMPEIVLTGSDRPPGAVEHRPDGVLVNAQPTLQHLRDGYFAEAVDLDAMEATFWQWQSDRHTDAGTDRKAGVFLITGPSGAGKSIAMLQLLARLDSRTGVTAILSPTSGPPSAALVDTSLDLGLHRRVVIGIDDPRAFAVGATRGEWGPAFGRLARERHLGSADRFPTIIACAWPANERGLVTAHGSDVSLREYRIDPREGRYRSRLGDWYRSRTGRETATDDDRTKLPAQLFFEWWNGQDAAESARRFRERVLEEREPAVVDFFDSLLALNRLSIALPEHMLHRMAPAARDVLTQYMRDAHIGRRTDDRHGVWLLHPLLADLYYDEWHDPTRQPSVRRDHLASALGEAFREAPSDDATTDLLDQCLATLDALPGERAHGAEDQYALIGALRVAAAQMVGRPIGRRALARWFDVERHCDGFDAWSPLDAIRRSFDEGLDEMAGAADALVALAAYGTEADVSRVWDLVTAGPEIPEVLVVLQYLAARGADPERLAFLVDRTRRALPDPDAVEVLAVAVRHHRTPALHRLVGEVLDGDHGSGSWVGEIAGAAVTASDLAAARVAEWLCAEARPENAPVFAIFLRRRLIPLDVQDALKRWLLVFPEDPTAELGFAKTLSWNAWSSVQSAVSRTLRSRPLGPDSVLTRLIVTMLHEDREAWSYVFQTLPAQMVRQHEIDAAARRWLREHPGSSAWSGVYAFLAAAGRTADADLVELGEDWVTRSGDPRRAGRVLHGMLARAPGADSERLERLALRWCADHPDDDGVGLVLPAVLRDASRSMLDAAVSSALDWLDDHPGSPGASYVIRATARTDLRPEDRQRLDHAVRSWLEDVTHRGWSFVYADFRHSLDPATRLDLTARWVPAHVDDPRWSAVLSSDRDGFSTSELEDLLVSWLGRQDTPERAVGFLWKHLVEEGPLGNDGSLERIAEAVFEWLARSERAASWWFVWTIYQSRPSTQRRALAVALRADLVLERQHGVGNRIAQSVRGEPASAAALWDELDAAPRSAVWDVVFLHLSAADPSPRAWEIGFAQMDRIGTDRFSPWWRRLWKISAAPAHRRALRPIGEEWIRSVGPDHPGATKVRAKLDELEEERITPATIAKLYRSD